jgi:hypothetical protein
MGPDILTFLGNWLIFGLVTVVLVGLVLVGVGAALDIRDWKRRPYRNESRHNQRSDSNQVR